MKRILIAGGTGFVGKKLIEFLAEKGFYLSVLTRGKTGPNTGNVRYFKWNVEQQVIDLNAFENVDTIINLTGANIGEKNWSKKRKKELKESRINAVDLLFKYVVENEISIKTMISSSAVGFYGAVTSDVILTENSPNGTDFLGEICREWELAARKFETINARVVILRKGVVVGLGGAYQKMVPMAKIGINSTLGSGKQYMPWIEVNDLVKMYLFFLENQQLDGVYNAVASEHVTMKDWSNKMLLSFNRKTILPALPAFLVKGMFGEMSVMLLEGTKVSNDKLKQAGFTFENDEILPVFKQLSKK